MKFLEQVQHDQKRVRQILEGYVRVMFRVIIVFGVAVVPVWDDLAPDVSETFP